MVALTREISNWTVEEKYASLRAPSILYVVRQKFILTGRDICVGESLSRSLMVAQRGYVCTSDRD